MSLKSVAFRERCAAFSLLEMIGVMAVAVIIALAFALTTTKSIDRTFSTNESTIMQNLANALQSSVLRTNGYIPGIGDWDRVIANELGVSITMVQTNDRRNFRIFLVDPAFTINTTNCQHGYIQTTDGADNPPNYRLMILSSITASLPSPITISAANFNNFWNTADGSIPTSADFSGYKGKPGDVIIQRINLSPLFVNLQLTRDSSGTAAAQYLIQGQPGAPLTVSSSGLNKYYLQNSLVTLINGASPAATNAEVMLSRSFSFFYVKNFWRSTPYPPVAAGSGTGIGADLASAIAIAAAMFVNSPYNSTATAGATPPGVLNAMSNFMASYPGYADWVVNSNGNNWVAPPTTNTYAYQIYTNAKTWQGILATNMANLATPAGSQSGSGNLNPGSCTNGPTL